MPNYRRKHVGDVYFFTLVTCDRMRLFDCERNRRLLGAAMRKTRRYLPWKTLGVVLLPDHLHLLWRLPPGDSDYSRRITAIKRRFTRAYLATGGVEGALPAGQRRKRHRGVWQRKFWEHTIRDVRDFRMHLDYIHVNPVKHGHVERTIDWPWSSFRRYVQRQWYEPDWQGRIDLPGTVEYIWPE